MFTEIRQRKAVAELRLYAPVLALQTFFRAPGSKHEMMIFGAGSMKKLLVVVSCLGLFASAQTQSPSDVPSTVIKANTRLVLVDVVATDKKGAPVTDLTAQDFTVLEDGKPQQVRNFSFQSPNPVTAAESSTPRNLPPNVFTNVPGYKPGGALNVILLDILNSTTLNQAAVQDNMLKVLEKVPGDRPVAVYALGRQLTLIQDFTTDPALLKNAVKAIREKHSPLLENATGGPGAGWIPRSMAEQMPAGMLDRIKEFIDSSITGSTDLRVTYTLDALQALARSFSGYPGRKNLIWVSESFPLTIMSNSNLNLAHGGRSDRNYEQRLAHTADLLTSAQVAVYTVDARGVVNHSFYSVGSGTSDDVGRPMSNPRTAGAQISSESDDRLASQAAESEVAEQTGGEAFRNTNDFGKVILKSMEDGSTYYTLAYTPENRSWDGRFRKIQVKTSHSGVKLRYRTGYFAGDPRTFEKESSGQRDHDLAQALNIEFPASTALLFQVRINQPSEKTGGKAQALFAIDPRPIVFEKQQDGLEHADLTCAIQIYSADGKPLRTEAAGLKAALPEDIYQRVMKSHMPCNQSFDLAPGDYVLRLGVRDNSTGLIGTADARVSVEKPTTGKQYGEPKPKNN